MKQQKEVKISYFAAHMTTVVSVTLVLLIIGTITLVTLGAAGESRRLREKIELSVIMADTIANDRAVQVCSYLSAQPYSHDVRLITKEEALKAWTEDTGEDLEQTFGVNPLSPEVTFGVNAAYASPDSLKSISARLRKVEGVEEVATPDASMVESMNRNLERLSMILGGIAIVLIIISFILINNTVHLAIYSRRFTIHTMQLVGATNGFIRRPFVWSNTLAGIISGVIASGLLAAVLGTAPEMGLSEVAAAIPWPMMGITAAGLIVIGVLLCMTASTLATNKYLRKDYDRLFR